MKLIRQLKQMPCKRAFAGTDFNHSARVLATGGFRELVQDRIPYKEVLPKSPRQSSV
jgi:hypothetical protein